MEYSNFIEKIKNKFDCHQLDDFNNIVELDKINLASMGSNDIEGYQVFTPEFIVKDMIKGIGDKEVFDIEKTILEPTSGDGAFTVYILNKRLEKIWKDDKANFEMKSLKALSTIYSVEMDKELILKQRNNIYTCVCQFIKNKKIDIDNSYFEIVKSIIVTNFIWAMFNSDKPIDMGLFGTEVIFKMPEAEKNDFIPLNFAVWDINDSEINFHEEGVDLW